MKYINYSLDKTRTNVTLYYAFPLIEKILKEYFLHCDNLSLFYNTNNRSQLSNSFEEIIDYDFKVNRMFQIDSFLEVDKIIDMNPLERSKDLKEYYSSKKRIFITQKIFEEESLDFGIALTEEKVLILIYAKYRLSERLDQKKIISKTKGYKGQSKKNRFKY